MVSSQLIEYVLANSYCDFSRDQVEYLIWEYLSERIENYSDRDIQRMVDEIHPIVQFDGRKPEPNSVGWILLPIVILVFWGFLYLMTK